MIIQHVCNGNKETSYHTFTFSTTGMSFILSSGSYFQNGAVVASTDTEVTINIPVMTEDFQYSICLTTNGIVVKQHDLSVSDYKSINVDNFIDLLGWFIVPANVSSLDNVNVNVKYVNSQD